jgi:SOS-response transcriptional repressor LexA
MVKQKVTLASFITTQREKLGTMSQVELAKKCGVPAGTIASIESGYAKSPRPVTLKKIAEGLAVPTEIIFKLASNPEKEMIVDTDDLNIFKITYLGDIPTTNSLKSLNAVEEQIPFPMDFIEEGDFILTVSGDSLSDEDIYDGDYITITEQDFLKRSGDLMLCEIDNVTTLRRVYKSDESFKIKDKLYSKDEISFLGKAGMSISRRKL